jgi:hypothetical protein
MYNNHWNCVTCKLYRIGCDVGGCTAVPARDVGWVAATECRGKGTGCDVVVVVAGGTAIRGGDAGPM